MTEKFVSVSEDTKCLDCLQLMTDGKFRRLPVKGENGTIVGFVSIGDLVRFALKEFRYTLMHYAEYVSGNYSAPITVASEEIELRAEKRKEAREIQGAMGMPTNVPPPGVIAENRGKLSA